MDSLPAVLALAGFGILAIVAGVIVWRNAERIVQDARRQLQGMFGDQPGLYDTPPQPLGARIAGAGFAVVGVTLLVLGAVLLFS